MREFNNSFEIRRSESVFKPNYNLRSLEDPNIVLSNTSKVSGDVKVSSHRKLLRVDSRRFYCRKVQIEKNGVSKTYWIADDGLNYKSSSSTEVRVSTPLKNPRIANNYNLRSLNNPSVVVANTSRIDADSLEIISSPTLINFNDPKKGRLSFKAVEVSFMRLGRKYTAYLAIEAVQSSLLREFSDKLPSDDEPAPTPKPRPRLNPRPMPKPTPEPFVTPTPKPFVTPTPEPFVTPTPKPEPMPEPTPEPTPEPPTPPVVEQPPRPEFEGEQETRPKPTPKVVVKRRRKTGPEPSVSSNPKPKPDGSSVLDSAPRHVESEFASKLRLDLINQLVSFNSISDIKLPPFYRSSEYSQLFESFKEDIRIQVEKIIPILDKVNNLSWDELKDNMLEHPSTVIDEFESADSIYVLRMILDYAARFPSRNSLSDTFAHMRVVHNVVSFLFYQHCLKDFMSRSAGKSVAQKKKGLHDLKDIIASDVDINSLTDKQVHLLYEFVTIDAFILSCGFKYKVSHKFTDIFNYGNGDCDNFAEFYYFIINKVGSPELKRSCTMISEQSHRELLINLSEPGSNLVLRKNTSLVEISDTNSFNSESVISHYYHDIVDQGFYTAKPVSNENMLRMMAVNKYHHLSEGSISYNIAELQRLILDFKKIGIQNFDDVALDNYQNYLKLYIRLFLATSDGNKHELLSFLENVIFEDFLEVTRSYMTYSIKDPIGAIDYMGTILTVVSTVDSHVAIRMAPKYSNLLSSYLSLLNENQSKVIAWIENAGSRQISAVRSMRLSPQKSKEYSLVVVDLRRDMKTLLSIYSNRLPYAIKEALEQRILYFNSILSS